MDKLFSDYKRPFPHDELADITKKCIVTYATILDKVFLKYKPKQTDPDDLLWGDIIPLGTLAAKIKHHSENLMKFRQKFEK
jgi:hypothetical protein